MVTTTDLVSYYKCDSNGTFPDAHASNDGTLYGPPTYTSGGIINGDYDYNGTSDYVDPGLTLSYGIYSISFWIKTTSSTTQDIIGWRDGTNNPLLQHLIISNKLQAQIRDTAGNIVQLFSTNNVNTGSWVHVVTIFDTTNDNYYLYINGTLDDSDTSTSVGSVIAAPFFGARNKAGSPADTFYDGELDEIGVWSRELSSQDVTDLYNSGAGLAYPFGAAAATYNSLFFGTSF